MSVEHDPLERFDTNCERTVKNMELLIRQSFLLLFFSFIFSAFYCKVLIVHSDQSHSYPVLCHQYNKYTSRIYPCVSIYSVVVNGALLIVSCWLVVVVVFLPDRFIRCEPLSLYNKLSM